MNWPQGVSGALTPGKFDGFTRADGDTQNTGMIATTASNSNSVNAERFI
jgi:hypothetical protein